MHPEVNSDFYVGHSEAHSVVLMNVSTFNLAMFALGVAESDAARARFIGVDAKTINKALAGCPVGWKMIGSTINTLRRHHQRLARVGLQVDLNTFFDVPETEQPKPELTEAVA